LSPDLPAGRSGSLAHAPLLSRLGQGRRPLALSILAGLLLALASFVFDDVRALLSNAPRLSDSDDALRLAQVRDLIAGGGWFNPVIASLGDGAGLASHWSRLLDAPIAGLIVLMQLFFPGAAGETAALVLWPKLVLAVFVTVLARQMLREAGAGSAAILVAMLLLSVFGLLQFRALRIDHHNVQNACCILAIVLATAPSATRRSALAAGLIAGFGLAIGYEALPIIGILAGLLAGAALLSPSRQGVAEGFAGGLAIMLAAAFVATVRPADWLPVPCDALGLNVVAGVVAGATGVFAAGWMPARFLPRASALGLGGLAAIACFAAIEPVCLAGPFAKVDPSMGPIWLDQVNEVRSIFETYVKLPDLSVSLALGLAGCLALQMHAVWRERDIENGIRLIMLVLTTALALRYLKMTPYGHLLAIYCAAKVLPSLPAVGSPALNRAVLGLAVLLLSPLTLSSVVGVVTPAAADTGKGGTRCTSEQDFAALAALPTARILPQPDLGGFFALMPRHQSVMGNYHRLDGPILKGHTILMSPVADAGAKLQDWRIDIVALCAGKSFFAKAAPAGSLAGELEAGKALPAYLQAIDLGTETDLRAYRVLR
jgi:hypothetical protein